MRLLSLSALAATLLWTTAVAAQPAIDAVVQAVAKRFAKAPAEVMVSSRTLQSDAKAPHGEALAQLLVNKLSRRLGPKARAHDKLVSVAAARKVAHKAPAFILLSPRIERGRLTLEADVYPVPKTVWARAVSLSPAPVAHARAHAPLDAEVRAFLEPVAFGEAQVSKFDGADPDIVALACGDLDGDGASEIVTMTRERVLLVAVADGKVVRKREARWRDLSPIAPVPLREPLGFATIVDPIHTSGRIGYLDVSISDRAGSARLDAELKLVTRMRGKAVPAGQHSGCSSLFDMRLGDKLVACDEDDAAPALAELRHRTDALASSFLISHEGVGKVHTALRKDNALVVRSVDGEVTIGRVGAQLAVGDLDQDGALELITTMDVLSRKHDKLDVRTLLPGGTVKRRFNLAVPKGVDAVAACPAADAGRAPLLVASAGQIWVVR